MDELISGRGKELDMTNERSLITKIGCRHPWNPSLVRSFPGGGLPKIAIAMDFPRFDPPHFLPEFEHPFRASV